MREKIIHYFTAGYRENKSRETCDIAHPEGFINYILDELTLSGIELDEKYYMEIIRAVRAKVALREEIIGEFIYEKDDSHRRRSAFHINAILIFFENLGVIQYSDYYHYDPYIRKSNLKAKIRMLVSYQLNIDCSVTNELNNDFRGYSCNNLQGEQIRKSLPSISSIDINNDEMLNFFEINDYDMSKGLALLWLVSNLNKNSLPFKEAAQDSFKFDQKYFIRACAELSALLEDRKYLIEKPTKLSPTFKNTLELRLKTEKKGFQYFIKAVKKLKNISASFCSVRAYSVLSLDYFNLDKDYADFFQQITMHQSAGLVIYVNGKIVVIYVTKQNTSDKYADFPKTLNFENYRFRLYMAGNQPCATMPLDLKISNIPKNISELTQHFIQWFLFQAFNEPVAAKFFSDRHSKYHLMVVSILSADDLIFLRNFISPNSPLFPEKALFYSKEDLPALPSRSSSSEQILRSKFYSDSLPYPHFAPNPLAILDRLGNEAENIRKYKILNLLIHACMHGNYAMVQSILVRKRFNPHAEKNIIFIEKAVISGHLHIIKLIFKQEDIVADIKKNGAKTLMLYHAIRHGHEDIVEFFLSQRIVSINTLLPCDSTYLMWAVFFNRLSISKLLLDERDIDPNVATTINIEKLADAMNKRQQECFAEKFLYDPKSFCANNRSNRVTPFDLVIFTRNIPMIKIFFDSERLKVSNENLITTFNKFHSDQLDNLRGGSTSYRKFERRYQLYCLCDLLVKKLDDYINIEIISLKRSFNPLRSKNGLERISLFSRRLKIIAFDVFFIDSDAAYDHIKHIKFSENLSEEACENIENNVICEIIAFMNQKGEAPFKEVKETYSQYPGEIRVQDKSGFSFMTLAFSCFLKNHALDKLISKGLQEFFDSLNKATYSALVNRENLQENDRRAIKQAILMMRSPGANRTVMTTVSEAKRSVPSSKSNFYDDL